MARILALTLSIVAGSLGAAYASPRPSPPVSASNGMVSIAGRPVLRFRTTLGAVPPDQRADIVALRLQESLARGVSPSRIQSRPRGRDVDLYWGQTLLLAVTPQEALAQRSSARSLADAWGHRLRTILSVPLLTVDRKSVTIPLGETRAIRFGGILECPQPAGGDPGVVAVTLDGARRRAVLRGLRAGTARVVFTRGNATIAVNVAVRRYAGTLPASVECLVTGNPAPADLIGRMAKAAAQGGLSLEPGAWSRIGSPARHRGLRAGGTATLPVPVRLAGPQYLSVEGRVPVRVRNVRLGLADSPRLFYSNDPERVKRYGTLFLGRLALDEPARLLYHHQNAMGRAFTLTVDVVNPGDSPARLHVVEGAAEPSNDPLRAGHDAARAFIRHQRAGVGYVASLPPRSLATIVYHSLKPSEVASGLFALRQIAGDDGCFVQVKVDDPRSPFVRPVDGSEALSPTIFGKAIKPVVALYEVGGQWTFIRLGSAHAAGATRLSEDGFGDYGITYDMALTLSNPTAYTQKVGLVFEAASGSARGVFVVDGKMIETRTLSAHEELVLVTYRLPPGGMRNVRLTTLPLSGSAYPARLVLRELPATAAVRPGSLLRPQ